MFWLSTLDLLASIDEVCDGVDNNCDGQVDEDVLQTFYEDDDNDTFGNPESVIQACYIPNGYVTNYLDCDDTNNKVYPWAIELCDGLDNNCDGIVDNCYEYDCEPE